MKSDLSYILMMLAVIVSYLLFTVGMPVMIQVYLRSRHLHDRAPGLGAGLGARYGALSAVACLALFLLYFYAASLRGDAWHGWPYTLYIIGALVIFGLLTGACLGYLTGLAIGLALYRRHLASSSRAVIISLVLSSAIAFSLNLLLIPILGVSPFGSQSPELYWLVLGIPSALQILLGSWGGAQIHRLQSVANLGMRPNTA